MLAAISMEAVSSGRTYKKKSDTINFNPQHMHTFDIPFMSNGLLSRKQRHIMS